MSKKFELTSNFKVFLGRKSGKIAEEYLMIADLMERHFKEE